MKKMKQRKAIQSFKPVSKSQAIRLGLIVSVVGGMCSLAWGGAVEADGDLYLFGDKTKTPPETFVTNLVGGTMEARHPYLAKSEGSAELLASDSAAITLTGNFCLGYATNTFAGVTSHFALTNATLDCKEFYTNWKGEGTSADAVDKPRLTVDIGPDSVINCKYFKHLGGPYARVDFSGGRVVLKNGSVSDGVFIPQSSTWAGGWPSAGATFCALNGPIDIELDENRTLVRGWAGRHAYFTGSHGFIKRGTGTLTWGWETTGNDGYLHRSASYTGDTVVKGGNITLLPLSSTAGKQAANDTPAASRLVLEAGTYFNLKEGAATFAGVVGAGMLTNTLSAVGTMILGKAGGDGEFSPAHVGGNVNVVKAGAGRLTINVASIPNTLIVSNGTAVVTHDLTAKAVAVSSGATLDLSGVALTCPQVDCADGGNVTADASTSFSVGSSLKGVKLTQSVASGSADNALSLGAGAELVKTGAGTLNLTGGAEGGALTVTEGTVTVSPRPKGYRHYRFKIDGKRYDNDDVVQFSELRLLRGTEDVTGLRSGFVTTNVVIKPADGYTCSSTETPAMVVDGNLGTKWCDFRGKNTRFAKEGYGLYVQLDYAEPIYVTGYDWATANDSDSRDPTSWRLLASDDEENWVALDTKTKATITTVRKTWTGPYAVTYPEDRPVDAAFGCITLEAGATLDLRGVSATCEGFVNRGGVLLTDADKPIRLTAAAGAEVRLGPIQGATFAGDLAKVGAGTNTFVGPYPINGTLAVTEGTVRCLAGAFGGAYYRLSIYSNQNGANVTQIGEFILLDSEGNRLNQGKYAVKTAGTAASALQEQEAAALWGFKTGSGEGIDKAFDGVFSKFCVTEAPTEEKPIGFVCRIPAGNARVASYTFVAGNDSSGGRNPKHWKLEGSADGTNWITLDERTHPREYADSTKEKPAYFNNGVPFKLMNEDKFAPSPDKACVFGTQGAVRVTSGATLDFASVLMSLAGISVDADAAGGTITRFTPCAGGTLAVTCTGPLSGCVGARLAEVNEMPQNANAVLKKWSVTVNGVANTLVRPVWRDGALMLENVPGILIMVR